MADRFLLNPLTLLVPEATTLFFPSHLHCPIHLFENGLHFLPQLPLISKLHAAGHPRPHSLRRAPLPPALVSLAHLRITQAPAQLKPLLPATPSPVALFISRASFNSFSFFPLKISISSGFKHHSYENDSQIYISLTTWLLTSDHPWGWSGLSNWICYHLKLSSSSSSLQTGHRSYWHYRHE